jgi:predicted carbohydrate-binding protein with CBM5 and CBM33 domain
VEQVHKKSKLSTDDIQTGSETFLFRSFPTPQSNRAFSSFSVSDTGEVFYNVNIINLIKLNTLSSQTNEEITKELPEYPNLRTNNNQKILNFKEDNNYYCIFCNEMLFNKKKYDRHCTIVNHKIAQSKLMNNSESKKLLIFLGKI